MIQLIDLPNKPPYQEFKKNYKKAEERNQSSIEAISISSWNASKNEVNSRIVNLKHINNEEWTFYGNYDGPKMLEFSSHNQIAAILYWNSINLQIRIKAKIFKTPPKTSDLHFYNRTREKNALAISSKQSQAVSSYEEVVENYFKVLQSGIDLQKRPKNWGGHSFIPYYFEFWEGHDFRLNKRKVFEIINNKWVESLIQP